MANNYRVNACLTGLFVAVPLFGIAGVCCYVSHRTPEPATALRLALKNKDVSALQSLLEGGVRVNTRCEDGSPADVCWCLPIHVAAREGAVDLVRLLLNHDADPNARCQWALKGDQLEALQRRPVGP